MVNAPRIAGWVLGVFAAVSLLSSISVGFRHVTTVPREWVDRYLISAPDTSFAWALVVALVAAAMAAGKRLAWWITVGYIVVFAGTNALYFVPAVAQEYQVGMAERSQVIAGVVIDAVAVAVLVAAYQQFDTRVRRGAMFTATAVLGGGLVAATLLGWALVEAFPRDLTFDQRLPYAFNRVVAFASVDTRTFDGHHTYGVINSLLGLLGALALICAAVVLLRSQRLSGLITPTDERVIRALIAAYNDDDSLAYFSTRRDKAVVFAPNGHAAITYRVELGVCLGSGDPIGDPRHWGAAITEFRSLCDRYGWHPAAMGTSQRGAQAYAATGMSVLNIGDETLVNTREYRITTPAMRPVRQAVTRCLRAGVTVRIRRYGELSDDELAAVARRADLWRDSDSERGFAMALSRVGDRADDACLLVEAVMHDGHEDEQVVGMLSFVPWGRTGASLDLMRRDRSSLNGLVETMVTGIAARADEFGIRRLSLNFVGFRAVFEQGGSVGAGPVMRGAHDVLTFASRFVQLESLYRSNAKYLPTWYPRFLCAADGRLILRSGMAGVVAEGLLRTPGQRRRERRRHVGNVPAVPTGLDVDALIAEIDSAATAARASHRRPEQVRVRMASLARLKSHGIEAYPASDPPSHTAAQALQAESGTPVAVAGRVLRLRDHGGVVFAVIRDSSDEIQILIEADEDRCVARSFARDVDLGDLVRATGTLGTSRTGEPSVLTESWSMLAKCLHPLPDKWSGLSDPEAKVRLRHVDLATDPSAVAVLRARSAVIKAIRDTLTDDGYLEVETPVLQRVHGGANAEPFRTHINAYDLDMYLRIAPELYLKRLCVGGLDRVFEIGRNFRNEGADSSHNPEFTSLEAYQAHGDHRTMMVLARRLIQAAATAAHGSPVALRPGTDGQSPAVIDISGDWPIRDVYESVSEAVAAALGRDADPIRPDTNVDALRSVCERLSIRAQPDWDAGRMVSELYEHLVETSTAEPTFYVGFPTSVSPLTRADPERPGVSQRWDLVAWGVELGTAYSELTDPIEQRARLTAQSERAAGGDPEAMEVDEDFLTALEYGMPPTGGLGLGIDRIVMLITGRSIRETLAFPLVRPR